MNHPAGLANVVEANEDHVMDAARRLRAGGLVAFPTETVYGLGGVVTSDDALRGIFRAKGRPFTDPLIAHVSSLEMAATLWSLEGEALTLCKGLCSHFWPGPLTLVVPAATTVSRVVTAGGDTVGIRMPAHPVARKLIEATGVPVAAPSANRFGHVSPTSARHVLDDLRAEDVLILDGGACQVGIESSVVRVSSTCDLEILRRGAITADHLAEAITSLGLQSRVTVIERYSRSESGVSEDAPGQLLIHYAPLVPAFLLQTGASSHADPAEVPWERCALVDFAGAAFDLAGRVRSYRDLSASGRVEEASENLFAVLRELELVPGLEAILLPDFSASRSESLLALADRLRRAAALRRAWRGAEGAQMER